MLFLLLFLLSQTPARSLVVKGPHSVRSERVTEEVARGIIQEKLRFLRLAYEQYQHPAYKYVKFPHPCLRSVKIVGPVEGKKGLHSESTIYYGEDFHPGLCPQHADAVKGLFLLRYCRKNSTLYQIRCPVKTCGRIEWGEEC